MQLLNTPVRRAIFCASLVAGLSAPAVAADPTVLATSRATLTNVSFRLVDLDPNDGIDPSVTFNSNADIRVRSNSPNGPQEVFSYTGSGSGSLIFSSPVNTATASLGLTPSSASVGGGGAQASSGTSLDDVLRFVRDPWERNFRELGGMASVGAYGPFSDYHNALSSLTLSGNTRLIIEGTAQINLDIDLNPLVSALTEAEKTKGLMLGLMANPFVMLNHQFKDPVLVDEATYLGIGSWLSDLPPDFNSSLLFRINADSVAGSDFVRSASATSLLSFQIDNLQNVTRPGQLGWVVQSGLSNGISYVHDVLPPGSPAIPEPGTWALMALGLCGVAWRTRRARGQPVAGNNAP